MDGAQEGTPEAVPDKKGGRGTKWLFIEMLCAFLAVSAVNNKLAEGRKKSERLLHQNEAFKFQVQSKWDDKVWVDQHGNAETKKTPSQCIAERVQDIKEDTGETGISAQYTLITKLARNVWLPKLRKLLDPQGGIRTGQVKEDVIEALRLQYFEYKQEAKKTQTDDAQKVEAAKAKFHPPEFYVFVQQGPLVIGGQNNVYLLETPADMQQALGGGGGRKKLREQNAASVQEEARSSKRQAVTCALSSALMNAARSPGGSSTSSVPSSASTFAASARVRDRDFFMVLDNLDRQKAAVVELMEYTACPEEKKKLNEQRCALLRKMAEVELLAANRSDHSTSADGA